MSKQLDTDMAQEQFTAQRSALKAPELEVSMFELLRKLTKQKKKILLPTIAAMVVAAAVSLIIPNIYVANTKLMPPQQQSGAMSLLSQLGGAASMAAGVAGLKNPNDLYVGMLKSRSVADRLIERFDLKKIYELDSQEKARKQLQENTAISAGKDGLITIEVEDKNKPLVAKIANGYAEELMQLTRTLAVTEASRRRMFFEKQLELSKNNLAAAESALKIGLDTHGVISVDVESRGIVETLGRLRAQISAKEIQLSSMGAFVTKNNPEYLRVVEELSSLRLELSRLENGRPGKENEKDNVVKQQGLENVKILRDVKYYQMLYELLAKQYEAARLDEAKDALMIQVLDSAIEPERKSKPKRAIIVLVVGLIAFLSAISFALFQEAKRTLSQAHPEKN